MIKFNRILFPVDLSQQCRAIAPAVAAMAARFHSRLQILHVLEPELSPYPLPAAATAKALERDRVERAARRKALDDFVGAFAGPVPAEPVILEGDAAKMIGCFAKQNAIDLIMMPTHGYGPFRRLLLGSVTTKVLHDVECPVWTEAHVEEAPARSSRPWFRFLCAVDESARDGALLKWCAQFALEQHADLKVVHAIAPLPARSGYESGLYDIVFEIARQNLDELQAEAGTSLDIRLRLGPVGWVVRGMAIAEEADLILVGRGAIQKDFAGLLSHAYSIIREAPCPVISL